MAIRTPFARIEPPDRHRFYCAAGAFVCVAVASLLVRIAGDTLFLGTYGRESLAIVYLGTAFVIGSLSVLFGAMSGRIPTLRLVSSSAFLLSLLIVGMRIALDQPYRPIRIGAYLLADLTVTGSMILFWTYFSQLFDSRKAKQLVGLVGAAGTSACMAAAMAAGPFNAAFGVTNLLIPVALLLAAFAAIVRLGGTQDSRESSRIMPPTDSGRKFWFRAQFSLLKSPHMRGLAWMVIIAVTTTTIVDFQFKAGAQAYCETSALPGFFGHFYAASNIAVLIIQLLLVSWALRRLGLLVNLALLPAMVAVTSAGVAVGESFGWIVASRFTVQVLTLTLDTAAVHVLFLGVRKQSYSQARALVDGLCRPVAMGLAGATLFATSSIIGPGGLAVAAILLAVTWLVLARQNYRNYLSSLVDSLSAKLLYPHERPEGPADRAIEQEVRNRLKDAPPEDLPYLLNIVREFDKVDLSKEIQALLQRPEPEAKIAALEQARQKRVPVDPGSVIALCSHPEAKVRRAAIVSVSVFDETRVTEVLLASLVDANPQVRAEAAFAVLRKGDPANLKSALDTLNSLVDSSDPEVRASVAAPLASWGVPGSQELLRRLLADPDPTVVRAALEACRIAPAEGVVPLILPQLENPATSEMAVNALEAAGVTGVMALRGLPGLQGPLMIRENPSLGLAIARVGGPEALSLTRDAIREFQLTPALARCLGRLLLQQTGSTHLHREVEQLLSRELANAKDLRRLILSLPDAAPTAFLASALTSELNATREKIFLLLEILVPGVDMQVLKLRAESSRPELHNQALEVLENLVPSAFRRSVTEVLETQQEPVALFADPVARILAMSHPATVLAGAIFAAGRTGRKDLLSLITRQQDHSAGLCREAVGDALALLNGLREVSGGPPTQADSDHPAEQKAGRVPGIPGGNRMITIERVLFLKNVPLFSRMETAELTYLAQITEEVVYPAESKVFTEGEIGNSMFVVVDGEVQIHRGEVGLNVLRSREYFGEMALLDGEPRSASATARTDCLLLAMHRRDFADLLTRHNSIARAVIATLCERLRSTLTKLPGSSGAA